MSLCPLCQQPSLSAFHQDNVRAYQRCDNCYLVSVAAAFRLSVIDERAIYDQHQNDPDDQRYRQFLARAINPLFERVEPDAEGLDFGCGPGPTISVMAAELGLKTHNYDLYYFNDLELLSRQYDFVTMTEVIEHVADALPLLQTLDSLLKPGAILVVMTKRVISEAAFSTWHYKQDLTHINFYSIETFEWIAAKFNWTLEVIGADVVFLTKAANS
ncbi:MULTISPECIES: class I SAM-dependent methyltransferase [unclassified Shewanella]|uniref:class I SAM-dependent methyltransferase n=1 Tax=unclassified Shewanella TaxID=196818 RepID=UPI000C7D966C|nr:MULTISPECIES: class I SAM-dependent methyltransferase [unclassified Shewanella]PKG55703.1 methyltransferase [Shewanella sp. GutDb-MelDb]PKG72748.1 methyltransferase [Shewanella sp. GutCb]